jgi:hypothetical protein
LKQQLSKEHVAAVNRDRRVSVQFDIALNVYEGEPESFDIEQLKEAAFDFIDDTETRIDSVWWDWCEGNSATWPSRILPFIDHPGAGASYYKKWAAGGIDPVRVILDETRRRGLEAFFAYRINGSDRLGERLPMKEAHPDWLLPPWTSKHYGPWNFAIQGVRDYKLSILRELADDYDFDGIEIDLARRCPVLPIGHQWESREALTDFMRSVRSMLLEVEEKRGLPFLLSARVPENLEGCHFDGIDVETWARERLVDIFVLGVRTFDVDIPAFRRITSGTDIKLYPCIDAHHSSDGYRNPPIEVFRGVLANWWSLGADGVQTFNWHYASPETQDRLGLARWNPEIPDRFGPNTKPGPAWATQRQVYRELVSPQAIEQKDKTFVVQRRGGGNQPPIVPLPEDWFTPRRSYNNTNMLAPLPASLRNDGKADTMLTVAVADDVATDADAIDQITIHLLISDPAAEHLPDVDRLDPATIATITHGPDNHLDTIPAAKGIEDQIELRLNNALLGRPTADQGWLVFKAQPGQLAVGNNLIGLRVSERPPDAQGEISVEKLEVHVTYR